MSSFIFSLALRSAWNRRFTLSLTIIAIALSTLMLIGMDRIRTDLRDSFTSAVSGTDLIVGARTGSVQLLLYSVFHVGSATNNIRWSSVESIASQPSVAWVIPLSLGDSHRGFPVLGTSAQYFSHFRYGDRQPLELKTGLPFSDLFDAVLGAEVAERLGYRIGDHITLAHGSGELHVHDHADKPFVISGILARTGTPVDRTVHVSLEAIEALHIDWIGGLPMAHRQAHADDIRQRNLQPRNVTAVMVGLKNRTSVFSMQRSIHQYREEPLMAILPGVALDELWGIIDTGEKGMLLMAGLVALVSLGGLVSVVLAGLNERRRELAILRATGATPLHVIMLLALEGLLITGLGIVLGIAGVICTGLMLGPWLQSSYGLVLHLFQPTAAQWIMIAALLGAGWAASLIPGWRAYRLSLADGLTPKN